MLQFHNSNKFKKLFICSNSRISISEENQKIFPSFLLFLHKEKNKNFTMFTAFIKFFQPVRRPKRLTLRKMKCQRKLIFLDMDDDIDTGLIINIKTAKQSKKPSKTNKKIKAIKKIKTSSINKKLLRLQKSLEINMVVK